MKKRPQSILFVDRHTLTFITPDNKQASFSYPGDSVKELEIVDEALFTKSVTEFITNNKITPSDALVILSSELFYEKEILFEEIAPKTDKPPETPETVHKKEGEAPPMSLQAQQQINQDRIRQAQLFLDAVPFDEIYNKTYKVEKGIKVIATNKTLVKTVSAILTKMNFSIQAVVPISMLKKELTTITGINNENAAKVFLHFDLIKQYNLLDESINILGNPTTSPGHLQMTTKVTSKREYALIGVFVCLLLILGGVSYTTFFPPVEKKIASSTIKPGERIANVSPTLAESAVSIASGSGQLQASDSAAFNKATVRIQIKGGTALQADLFKQTFVNAGYSNVTTNPTNQPAANRTVVVFGNTVPTVIREVVLAEIRKNVLNVTVQESALPQAEVVINL